MGVITSAGVRRNGCWTPPPLSGGGVGPTKTTDCEYIDFYFLLKHINFYFILRYIILFNEMFLIKGISERKIL